MTKKKEAPQVDNEIPAADKALEDAKGKFQAVMVIGITDENTIDVSTNVPQYAVMQYWLNRAIFELLIHEKNNAANMAKEAAAE